MSNDLSAIQNQIQSVTQVYCGGHGHGRTLNNMQTAISEDEKEPQIPFKSEMTAKISVDQDANSKQNKKQQQEESSQEQAEDEKAEEEPFGLDTLEIIGQMNMLALYTRGNIKNRGIKL